MLKVTEATRSTILLPWASTAGGSSFSVFFSIFHSAERVGATDVISAEIQERTAEQMFSVLGQLKGGAMKLGQALSVFEAALPDALAEP